ncbi:MAG TPA: Hsp20/alpha crystallin family protein [Cyclobacteriaceae bacterium]|nr:Hsp20/alpha crystallin family protein [Cyclobacteriaceae bacterium]
MSLIKRSEWPSLVNGSWLSDFFDNDRFFDAPFMRIQSIPAVNISENEKNFEISLAAPGLSRKDFNVSVENGALTISSEKKEEKETKEKDFTRQEYSYSSFSRSFTLPENAKEDDVNAKYEDGVLKVTLGKKALPSQKAKKAIEVH